MCTCDEPGRFFESMSLENISCLENHFRRLDTLNCNHITDGTQHLGFFTCDQVSLLQLSKNWWSEERRNREDNHTLAHTR